MMKLSAICSSINKTHTVDICIRFGAGLEIKDKSMTEVLNAYHQCWMQFGPAKVLYSDGEGALNNDTSKSVLKDKGAELRIRARG